MKKYFYSLVILTLPLSLLYAQATTKAQAKSLVTNWMSMEAEPLSEPMSSKISDITTYTNDLNETLYHIVSLSPDGFVVIAGDDMVEPIVAFAPYGSYEDSLDNPMGALIKNDIPARVLYQREQEEQRATTNSAYQANSHSNKAKDKWNYLIDGSDSATISKEDTISDVYVEPFILSKWNQKEEAGGANCYNLYTPSNYYSGCVATAFAQVLRYFEYPNIGVGTESFEITVDGVDENRSLLGGDGSGGVYDWNLMSYGPYISESASRIAIGRLMNDTGVSVRMSYTSGGSGAWLGYVNSELIDTFKYSNSIRAYNDGENINTADRNTIINSNLDAKLPIVLGVSRYDDEGNRYGHAILSDGYGYNSNTLYNHLNMGWGGSADAWYNLPTIDTGSRTYTSVDEILFNIYPIGDGEIISGRITDAATGLAIQGALVSASNGFEILTDIHGVYALTLLPSNTEFTINVTAPNYTFNSQTEATLISQRSYNYDEGKYITTVGNKWGVNFTGTETIEPKKSISPSIITYLLN